MKRVYGLCHKAHAVTQARHLRVLLFEYVDERKKKGAMSPVVAQMRIAGGDYQDAIQAGEAPLRAGKDYIPSRKNSSFRLFGLVRQAMTRYFPDVDAADPKEVNERVHEWWLSKCGKRHNLASHFVFAMHPAIMDGLKAKGVSVDDVLFANAARAFEIYSNRHYPNQQIGWVGGVHHDTRHPHLHAVVFPLTSEGRQINVSTLAAVSDGRGGKVRVDFQGTLTRAYYEQCKATDQLVFGDPSKPAGHPEGFAASLAVGNATLAFLPPKVPGRERQRGEYAEAVKKAEALSADTVQAYVNSMAKEARKTSADPKQIEVVENNIRHLRSSLATRRTAISEALGAVVKARELALKGLHSPNVVGRAIGYNLREILGSTSPETPPDKAIEPLLFAQRDRGETYREAVKNFTGKARMSTGPYDFAQVNTVICQSSIVVSQMTGKVPDFLANNLAGAGEGRITTGQRTKQVVNRLAEITAKHRNELRPFTVEEFGNKALSPYRDHRAPEVPPEQEVVDVDYVALSQKYLDSLRARPAPMALKTEALSPSF